MEYPEELLRDIYWAFSNGQFGNEADFKEELKTYHKAIAGKALSVQLDDTILDHPKVVIQYMKYNDDEEDYDEPQEIFEADNGKSFKTGELLFKINETIGLELEEEDNRFFEGLTFGTEDDPDFPKIPVYFLDTGT